MRPRTTTAVDLNEGIIRSSMFLLNCSLKIRVNADGQSEEW